MTLEPDNWRHHFRLSFVSWGEERLRAAHRTLALLPDFPLAHWLCGHRARGAAGAATRPSGSWRRASPARRVSRRARPDSAPSRCTGCAVSCILRAATSARALERIRTRAVVRSERPSLRARVLREHLVCDRCHPSSPWAEDRGRSGVPGSAGTGAEASTREAGDGCGESRRDCSTTGQRGSAVVRRRDRSRRPPGARGRPRERSAPAGSGPGSGVTRQRWMASSCGTDAERQRRAWDLVVGARSPTLARCISPSG